VNKAVAIYYQQSTISVRQFHEQGKFGVIYYSEAEYQHAGLEGLYFEKGKHTWRHGLAPMHYPTHCTAFLTGVTGERLTGDEQGRFLLSNAEGVVFKD
jgi:hypothetical protein